VRLSELLSPSRIRVPLKSHDKAGILGELVDLLLPTPGAATDREEVLEAVLERERQFPTGIGFGVAVPHGKTPALSGLGVVAGTSSEPVSYETVDGQPVRLFFLMAGPETMAGTHVKAISRIARLVRHETVRSRLLGARTPDEFYRVLCEAEEGGGV
jgi:mannitol/fructose-specific phosphotransferase system IIA component (Ntr-type)